MGKETRSVKYRKAVILPKAKLFNRISWLLQEKYNGKMTAGAKRDIERLKAGEPLDYIIGFVEFLGCKILVNKNVLIPRFETEFWTEQALSDLIARKDNLRVLDMFAGSGCIGISIMRQIRNSNVVFVDSEKETLGQIKRSCAINQIPKNRYTIIESDVFSEISGKFDYIFANPPYISIVKKNKIQKSVINYEPKEALFGGNDGLLYITEFLTEAKNFLNLGGSIYMEFDTIQKKKIDALLKKIGYKKWEFHKDQYNKVRWVAVNNYNCFI